MSALQKSIFCIVFIFFAGVNVSAELIKLNDVGVTFEMPEGFTALSEKEMFKYLNTCYSPGSKIPDTMGDAERKMTIIYRTYVSSNSRHKANLKKEKKDIEDGLKNSGAIL